MFKIYEYKIDLVTEPFENLKYRDRTVLVMCRDNQGKFLLGGKEKFYPAGIVRLLGGGVEKNEEVVDAAIREIREEMGLLVKPEELTELAEVKVTGNYKDVIYKTSIFICFLGLKKDDYLAGDDVSGIFKYSEKDFEILIERYFQLKDTNLYSEDGSSFSWGDYGKVYGFIHQVALDEVLSRGL